MIYYTKTFCPVNYQGRKTETFRKIDDFTSLQKSELLTTIPKKQRVLIHTPQII